MSRPLESGPVSADTIEAVGKQKEDSLDAKLAALAERLEESRRERKRSDERLDELQRRFEIAHRRLRELARSA